MITVLLVDDHTSVLDALGYILNAAGDIQILSMASNGGEAVEQAIRQCPDVVVVDFSMPIQSGLEAMQRISEVCKTTKVIFLSMHNNQAYARRAFKAGAFGYLLKDSAHTQLITAIRDVHDGKRYLSPEMDRTFLDDEM